MDRRAPRHDQLVHDALTSPTDQFGSGHDGVLSFAHGVAIANQPIDVETGPVMVPVAFAARVSDKDNQDPTLSIPRQLARCREALPPWCVIVAFFWDVESGRLDLDQRGHSDAHEQFNVPVPRDGGIADLFEEARRSDRRFVAVVCESAAGRSGSEELADGGSDDARRRDDLGPEHLRSAAQPLVSGHRESAAGDRGTRARGVEPVHRVHRGD